MIGEFRTTIMYESPHRLIKTLEMLLEMLPEGRRISVSRELTKIYEETVTGTCAEVLTHFQAGEVKGEIVIVVEGKL